MTYTSDKLGSQSTKRSSLYMVRFNSHEEAEAAMRYWRDNNLMLEGNIYSMTVDIESGQYCWSFDNESDATMAKLVLGL